MKPLSHIAEQVNESSTLAMDALYKQMKADGIDVLGFAAGEPDFPTPDRIKLAAIEAIINNETKYTPATGTMESHLFLRVVFSVKYCFFASALLCLDM